MLRIERVLSFLLYGSALVGFVPLFPYLAMAPRLVFPCAFAAALLVDRFHYRFRGWLPTVVSLIFFFYYGAQFTRDNVAGPAVNLLVMLLAVRLVGEKTSRTCLQIFALSLFSLASSSLFNLSPVFLLYVSLILVMIAVSLVILTFRDTAAEPSVTSRELRRILSVSILMPAASVPLMLLFFVIMPRTQLPLWNFYHVGGGSVSGFSEKVDPGRTSAVGESRDVAFRAHCPKLPKDRLYWRGSVLNSFSGGAWVRSEPPARERKGVPRGDSIRQTIYPEPGRMTHLVALDIPWGLSGVRATRADDHTATLQSQGAGRIKYDAVSVQGETIEGMHEANRIFYLRVPEDTAPRMVALGKQIAGTGGSDRDKISRLEEFFASRPFTYATTNLPVGSYPLDQFLFVTQRGNCEFYASSFALLLRLAGVPSRLVGGYYGGDYNELGGYYAVTDARAHVWVEAFVAGTGWVSIDPSSSAVNFSGADETGRTSLARRLALTFDAYSYFWNVAVITYDLERQINLIGSANAGLKRLSLHAALAALALLAGLTAAAVLAAALVRRRRVPSRERKILSRFLRRVRKSGRMAITPATGLHEIADALNDAAVSRFVALYGNAVYHDRSLSTEELQELKLLLGKISTGEQTGRGGGRRDRGSQPDLPDSGVDNP